MSDTTYPWTSLLLWFLTTSLELPDSDASSTKRQELAFTRLSFTRTPFLYIGSRPAASTLGLRHSCIPMAASQQTGTVPKTLQRYGIFRNLYRFIQKKNENCFSQGLWNHFWSGNWKKSLKKLGIFRNNAYLCTDKSRPLPIRTAYPAGHFCI